jgi:hypothetical protein
MRLRVPFEQSEQYPGAKLPKQLEISDCEHCDAGVMVYHTDCFRVFMRNCNINDRLQALWTRAQWRAPFQLTREDGWAVNLPCLRTPARALRQDLLTRIMADLVPKSIRLPLEIVNMIWDTDSLQGSDSRRLIAVLSLCRDVEDICHHGTWLDVAPPDQVILGITDRALNEDEGLAISRCKRIPLEHIVSWRRGESPKLLEKESDVQGQPTITIDSSGILSISRDSRDSSIKAKQSTETIYAWPHEHGDEDNDIGITFTVNTWTSPFSLPQNN